MCDEPSLWRTSRIEYPLDEQPYLRTNLHRLVTCEAKNIGKKINKLFSLFFKTHQCHEAPFGVGIDKMYLGVANNCHACTVVDPLKRAVTISSDFLRNQ